MSEYIMFTCYTDIKREILVFWMLIFHHCQFRKEVSALEGLFILFILVESCTTFMAVSFQQHQVLKRDKQLGLTELGLVPLLPIPPCLPCTIWQIHFHTINCNEVCAFRRFPNLNYTFTTMSCMLFLQPDQVLPRKVLMILDFVLLQHINNTTYIFIE